MILFDVPVSYYVAVPSSLVREFEHFQSDETLTAELNAVLSVLRALPDKHAQSEDREPAYYTIIQADEEVSSSRFFFAVEKCSRTFRPLASLVSTAVGNHAFSMHPNSHE